MADLSRSAAAPQDSIFLALMACVGAVALGVAIELNEGLYDSRAMGWLVVALVASGLGICVPRHNRLERFASALLPWVVGAGLIWQTAELHAIRKPVKFFEGEIDAVVAFNILIVALLVGGLSRQGPWVWLRRHHAAVMTALCALLVYWVVAFTPNTMIDVRVFHRDALLALFHGQNPYGITFPNIYENAQNYGPGMVENGRIMFGYMYPPLTLLLGALGQGVGDVRYALGAAFCLGVLCMLTSRPSLRAAWAATLLITTPRGPYTLEMAWTEPLMFACLAAMLWCAFHWPKGVAVALGLFAVSKQYAPLLAPTALLLPVFRGRQGVRAVAIAAGVGALVTLPFVAWGPSDFWRGLVSYQLSLGFRHDALNFVAWWSNTQSGAEPTFYAGFALGVLALYVVLRQAPRTPAGVALGAAFTCLVFIAFNRQAFCNYYWFILACMLVAMAVTQSEEILPEAQGTS